MSRIACRATSISISLVIEDGPRVSPAKPTRLGGQVGVDDRVGNAVANLVGMPLRDRLAGKDKIVRRQEPSPCKNKLHVSGRRHEVSHSGRNPTGPLSQRLVVECHAASVKRDLPRRWPLPGFRSIDYFGLARLFRSRPSTSILARSTGSPIARKASRSSIASRRCIGSDSKAAAGGSANPEPTPASRYPSKK